MRIHVLDGPASPEQVTRMLEALRDYVKVAVDIERAVVAGGGVMHTDCEQALLDSGSCQEHVWGGDWIPESATVRFASLINVRPIHGNRSVEVQDPDVRRRMEQIIRRVFTGV